MFLKLATAPHGHTHSNVAMCNSVFLELYEYMITSTPAACVTPAAVVGCGAARWCTLASILYTLHFIQVHAVYCSSYPTTCCSPSQPQAG